MMDRMSEPEAMEEFSELGVGELNYVCLMLRFSCVVWGFFDFTPLHVMACVRRIQMCEFWFVSALWICTSYRIDGFSAFKGPFSKAEPP